MARETKLSPTATAVIEQGTDPAEIPFWRRKSLAEMTDSEWESLCDGCGRCCLVKLEEEADPVRPADNPNIYYTDVGCRLLDETTCRCADYPNRSRHVHDCVRLTPAVVDEIGWLPPSCGYRLVNEGRDLYWWHHLVSGDRTTVHQAGVSVRGRVFDNEVTVDAETLEERVVGWPLRLPRRAGRKT